MTRGNARTLETPDWSTQGEATARFHTWEDRVDPYAAYHQTTGAPWYICVRLIS
jgi:hypothetical protein